MAGACAACLRRIEFAPRARLPAKRGATLIQPASTRKRQMSGYRRATTLLGVARAVALAALVASCSSSKDAKEMSCPTTLPAPGADTIAVFHPGSQEPKDLLFAGQISNLTAECS